LVGEHRAKFPESKKEKQTPEVFDNKVCTPYSCCVFDYPSIFSIPARRQKRSHGAQQGLYQGYHPCNGEQVR
jgi:hypothetical protein